MQRPWKSRDILVNLNKNIAILSYWFCLFIFKPQLFMLISCPWITAHNPNEVTLAKGRNKHLCLDLFHFKSANKLDDWRRTIKMSILYVDTCMQSKSNSDGVILVALPWLDEYQLLPTWCYRLLVKVPNKEITKVI